MKCMTLLEEKREAILELAEKHGAYDVRVFGSVLRGEDSEESDVDFLVKRRTKTSPWFPASLKCDLEDLLGREVDVVVENALHWYIRDKVLAEAKPL